MTNTQRRLRRAWRNLRLDLICIGFGVLLIYAMTLALHGMMRLP
jgi:hypothetical protein